MPTVRRTLTEANRQRILAAFAGRPVPSEEEIERQAAEDDNAWTEGDVASAVPVSPPPTAEQVREVRTRLGLSQAQFARRFGFSIDTLQQYEQGRRAPSGPASTLLRVIAAEPEAVARALAK
jgi:putative transcriptional regulator